MGSAAANPGRVIFLSGLTAGALCLGLAWPLHAVTPGAQAGIDTALTLLALLSVMLLGSRFRRTRRIDDVLLAAALNDERKRLTRNLHDGLAQDLAFIAVSAQRLEPDLGPQHPLVIAARRALDASRGLMADLAARSAPTTRAALAVVADELGRRFGVQVVVNCAPAAAPMGRADLSPREREEIVMIAREAIVNAITHGCAKLIDVTLDLEGERPLLLVSDDGGGVTSGTPQGGFGLPTMRARAASLGGRLVMRQRPDGGTELEVRVVPAPPGVRLGLPTPMR